MRSADIAAKLTADPESPCAEYNRGKPLTQRGLARLLADFHIIPETVHPPGLPQGKGIDARGGRGYRADFDRWEVNDQWAYERGRTWDVLTPGNIPLRFGGKINPAAVAWFRRHGRDIL
jgi:Protein of unknown function (DUF3631)